MVSSITTTRIIITTRDAQRLTYDFDVFQALFSFILVVKVALQRLVVRVPAGVRHVEAVLRVERHPVAVEGELGFLQVRLKPFKGEQIDQMLH